MDVLIDRCAGLDVHKKSVVACIRGPGVGPGERRIQTRTFRTTMKGLEALRDWLGENGVTHAVMESTGVYWCPVHAVLEEQFDLMLVNARHVKKVPGRKTDVKDSEWLAQLLECGLLRGSFIPPPEIRDLRDLTRTRKQLVRERSREVTRVAKLLELANIKLGSVVTDIMCMTGRAILDAMAGGEDNPRVLARLTYGSLSKKREEIAEAVTGLMRDHHRFLLKGHLARIDQLTRHIEEMDSRIVEVTRPFEATIDLFRSIPGVAARSAEVILAEIGEDMSRFPTPNQFASWAGLCPGNHESAGKRRHAGTGKGNAWLRDALSQVAWAAARTRTSYYRALYYRHKARGGPKKAIVVVQHAILVAIWHMLTRGVYHEDLGPNHFQTHDKERQAKHLLRRLKKLGLEVQVKQAA